MIRKRDFDEFVKRKQAKKRPQLQLIGAASVMSGLTISMRYTHKSKSFLEDYLSAGEAQREYREIQLNEENIGSYAAERIGFENRTTGSHFHASRDIADRYEGARRCFGPARKARLLLLDKKATNARSLIKVTVSETPPSPSGK